METAYIIKWLSDISDIKSAARQVNEVNRRMAKNLTGTYAKATSIVGTSLKKISKTKIQMEGGKEATRTVQQLGTVMQTSTGKFQEFTETTTHVNGALQSTKGTLKDVTGQYAKTSVETAKASKNFSTMGANLKQLAGRALLTIPVWTAFRSIMQGVSKGIKEGTKALIEQDRALQKAKRNLGGTTEEIAKNFEILKRTTQEFSLESGESIDNIVTAFQRFSTTGLDFETSMSGAIASTKTAVLLFGETEEVANSVARAFRVLGGRTDEFTSKGEELESFLALISELWKTNAFEVGEFASAIERIAPTAKSANISLHETAILLSAIQTAGIRGSRAGRLLSTAITQMEKNFDKFNKVLGVNVRSVDTTFERLMMIADAVNEIKKSDPVKAGQAITKLFGRRSGDIVKALSSMSEEIKKMVGTKGDIIKFQQEFEAIKKEAFLQVKIFKNLRTEIQKALVIGATGGENFADGMLRINEVLKSIKTNAKQAGDAFRTMFGFGDVGIFAGIIAGGDKLKEQFKKIPKEIQKSIVEAFDFVIPMDVKAMFPDLFLTEELADKIVNNMQENIKKSLETQAKTEIAPEDVFKLSEVILSSELERLETQGALNSELLKAESLLRKQLGIEQEGIELVKDKLELERELRAERELQSRLSSTSIKLFDIAQEEGTSVAKRIGEVLSGEFDFSTFVKKGGKELEVFKKNFEDIFKQQQAEAFFKGETVPGAKGLKGGAGIVLPVADEGIRGTGIIYAKATSAFETAVKVFSNAVDKAKTPDKQVDTRDTSISGLSKAIDKSPFTMENEIAKLMEDYFSGRTSVRQQDTASRPFTGENEIAQAFEVAKANKYFASGKGVLSASTKAGEVKIEPSITTSITVEPKIDVSSLDKAEALIIEGITKQMSRVGSKIYNSLVTALTGKQNKVL